MTRCINSGQVYSSTRSAITDTRFNNDNFINLPDFSNLSEDEKQHILNVLGRDENLRNKHLSHFAYVDCNNIHIKTHCSI